jgi:hypothetical protein
LNHRFGLAAEGLEKLHALSVELPDLLKENDEDQTRSKQLLTDMSWPK